MQCSKQQAERVFGKLRLETVDCKHHRAGFLVVNGVRILKVHYSHGRGDMPPTVVELFRKSLRLSRADFQELIGCHMSRDQYLDSLGLPTEV